MRARPLSLVVVALALGGADALAQPATADSLPSGAAMATPGVTPIDTRPNATVGASPSDRALRESIVSALGADPALQGARINISVRDGAVNLSGTARDRGQADRARAIAENIAGASRVNASISTAG